MGFLDEHLKDQIGIVFAHTDVSGIAKVVNNFSRGNENLRILAGFFESRVIDADMVVRIASLPSREVLLAQVCGGLQAPMQGFVSVLHVMLARVVWCLKQVADKK